MGRNANPGRGGGRNSGKGGRGKGFKKQTKPQVEKKHVFTLLANTADVRVSTHETTLKKLYEYLMQNIKDFPNDLVDSLKDDKKKVFKEPTLDLEKEQKTSSADEKEEEKARVSATNQAKFLDWANQKQEIRLRKHTLESNLGLAYTIIFSKFCDKDLQWKLEGLEDFDKIEDDPIYLLSAIKKLMHTTSHEKLVFPYETLWSTLAQLFRTRQDKEERFIDYYNKFKAFSQQARKYLQDNFLDEFVESLDSYKKLSMSNASDKTIADLMKKNAWNRLLAYGLLHNSDQERYGRLLKEYRNDYAKNQDDNFQQNMVEMKDKCTHAFNDSKLKRRKNNVEKNNNNNKKNEPVEFATSFAQLAENSTKKVCWVCGGDHLANQCKLRDIIPKDKWFKKTMSNYFTRLLTGYSYYISQGATCSTASTTSVNSNRSRSHDDDHTVTSDPVQPQHHQQVSNPLTWESFPGFFQLEISHNQQKICENKSINFRQWFVNEHIS